MAAKSARAVLADALRLDRDARAELAAELIASLDGPGDADVEAAWEEEIRRRVEDLDAGRTTLIPWDEVRQRIERRVPGPRQHGSGF